MAERTQVDLDAFVTHEYPKVVAAVGLITGNRQDAADAVQDAIVGFLAKPPTREITNVAAWITVVASNRARDLQRSRGAGNPLVATGSTTSLGGEHLLRASIPGLCVGATYYAQLELIDDTGRTTVWSVDRETSASWWGGSIVIAPRLLFDLVYDFRSQSYMRSYLYTFDIEFNGASLHPTDERSGRCLADGITESHGRVDGIPMYIDNQVTVELRITASRRWGDAEAWDAECLGDPGDEPLDVVTFDFSYGDLLSPYGVVLTSNEGYPIELVLHGYNARPEPRP